MEKQNLLDFEKWLNFIDKYYQQNNVGLFNKKLKKSLKSFFGNYVMVITCLYILFLWYQITQQYIDFYSAVQQLHASMGLCQVPARALQRIWSLEEMDKLVQWFRKLYDLEEDPDYKPIINKSLTSQNKIINKIVKYDTRISSKRIIIYTLFQSYKNLSPVFCLTTVCIKTDLRGRFTCTY